MTTPNSRPREALERVFHEPNRLAILSALCAASKGMSFNELKETCGLTDGNLSRHLKALEEAGVVRIEKAFVQSRPRTTIHITRQGVGRFNEYLAALSRVLEKAKGSVRAENPRRASLWAAKPAVV